MKNEWQRYIPLWIKIGILLILVPLTFVYSIPWAIQHALHTEYSGIDLHAYWYAGHFFRQGVNPYVAIMYDPTPDYWIPGVPGSGDPDRQDYNRAPIPPVHYLDGMVADTQPIAQALIMPPAMAGPLAVILGLTAWFSWPSARVIWIVISISGLGV